MFTTISVKIANSRGKYLSTIFMSNPITVIDFFLTFVLIYLHCKAVNLVCYIVSQYPLNAINFLRRWSEVSFLLLT